MLAVRSVVERFEKMSGQATEVWSYIRALGNYESLPTMALCVEKKRLVLSEGLSDIEA
jgi:hypothetical protein